MKETQLYIGYAGHCYAKEKHAIKSGQNKNIVFHALFALIKHPEKGYILFDTGYSKRFYDATKRYPSKIYANATKVVIGDDDDVKSQLIKNNINPNEIKYIILSHFHADHTGGLIDFPNATIFCSKKAWQYTNKLNPYLGFSKGVLKKQHPKNIEKQIKIIEEICTPTSHIYLGNEYDLFNDRSILIYDLPGHAAGQIGIRLSTLNNKYFFVADACWLSESYRNYVLPHQIVRLFFHSWRDYKNSLLKIHNFHKNQTDEKIIPTHCKETTDQLVKEIIDWNVL